MINGIDCNTCDWSFWCDKSKTNCLYITAMLGKSYSNVMHSRRYSCHYCEHKTECDMSVRQCREYGGIDSKNELKKAFIERTIK